jgi:hypothetical protein
MCYIYIKYAYRKHEFLECVDNRICILVTSNYEACDYLMILYLAQLQTRHQSAFYFILEVATALLNDLYKECHLLVCDSLWVLLELTFRRNVSPSSSVLQETAS